MSKNLYLIAIHCYSFAEIPFGIEHDGIVCAHTHTHSYPACYYHNYYDAKLSYIHCESCSLSHYDYFRSHSPSLSLSFSIGRVVFPPILHYILHQIHTHSFDYFVSHFVTFCFFLFLRGKLRIRFIISVGNDGDDDDEERLRFKCKFNGNLKHFSSI